MLGCHIYSAIVNCNCFSAYHTCLIIGLPMQAKKIKTEEDPCLQPACTVLNYSEKKTFQGCLLRKQSRKRQQVFVLNTPKNKHKGISSISSSTVFRCHRLATVRDPCLTWPVRKKYCFRSFFHPPPRPKKEKICISEDFGQCPKL